MGTINTQNTANVQFGSTDYADTVPLGAAIPTARLAPDPTASLAPSEGPVYLEGRLVLSLSFQNEAPEREAPGLDAIENDEVVLENYRLWDEATDSWFEEDDLAVLRFEHADVVMRLEPSPKAIWSGALNTRARVILVPDLDAVGFRRNLAYDLCWKRA